MSHSATLNDPRGGSVPPPRPVSGRVCPRCRRCFDDMLTAEICPHDGAPLVRAAGLPDSVVDPMVGRVIAGRFTVLSRLGEGAMGTVYRAKQSPIGREVAVKILRSERALDETSRGRFLREARANSLLASPNTVTVFDFGTGDTGEFYLAMELLEGESLGQRLKRVGRLDAASALDVARQALRSLAEAHEKGIIHRDLKPDNLFFARLRSNEAHEEIVKVLDFGIAKMLRADDDAIDAVETQAGTVFGTPRYMSPEQAQGKPLDARSDLYSLGVILYQMLTGRPPFTDDDAIVVMARHIKTMPRAMSEAAPEAHIPPEVENAVMRVLSKDPAKRPQTADAMATELARAGDTALSVTSGIRASLAGAIESKHEVAAVSPANDTLDAPHAPPHLRSRSPWRWAFAAALAMAAAAGITAFVGRAQISPLAPAAHSGPLSLPAANTAAPGAPLDPVPVVPVAPVGRRPLASRARRFRQAHMLEPVLPLNPVPLPVPRRHNGPTRAAGARLGGTGWVRGLRLSRIVALTLPHITLPTFRAEVVRDGHEMLGALLGKTRWWLASGARMDPSKIDSLVHRLVADPHDEEALRHGPSGRRFRIQSRTRSSSSVLGLETREMRDIRRTELSEAANVWSTIARGTLIEQPAS